MATININSQTTAHHFDLEGRAQKSEDIRTKHGENTIVLFVRDGFYEAVEESAKSLHVICHARLISCGNITYTYFKKDSDFWVFPKMIRKGFKLCIIDN